MDVERIAVFCPNLVGDAAMATPALRALRKGYPGARILGVIKAPIAPTLEGVPWVDDWLPHDRKARSGDRSTRGIVSRLRRERIDVAVLLPNSFRSAAMAWLGGAKRRVGYARGGRSWLLTDRLDPPRADGKYLPTPAVHYYLAIAKHLGCAVDSVRLELFTTPAAEAAADDAWSALGLSTGGRVVALNTGGAFGPAKNWPESYFAEVARRLADEDGASVLVLCGPSERESARRIVAESAHPRVTSLADRPPSLGLSKACLRRCSLLVTTDSGPRHLATGFGVPVVTLFGPTHIAWTRTYHPRALHLQHRVPCGPCQRPTCSEGHHRCMTELLPESVLDASRRLL